MPLIKDNKRQDFLLIIQTWAIVNARLIDDYSIAMELLGKPVYLLGQVDHFCHKGV